jgi:hypothetical protein
MFLGLMTYLDPKGEGTGACQESSGHREGVEDGPLWDPCDMAKAGLFEA